MRGFDGKTHTHVAYTHTDSMVTQHPRSQLWKKTPPALNKTMTFTVQLILTSSSLLQLKTDTTEITHAVAKTLLHTIKQSDVFKLFMNGKQVELGNK